MRRIDIRASEVENGVFVRGETNLIRRRRAFVPVIGGVEHQLNIVQSQEHPNRRRRLARPD